MGETWVLSLGWEDPLEKGKGTHSSTLTWRIPWTITLTLTLTSSNNTREDYTWTSPYGQYRNQIDYILCSQR